MSGYSKLKELAEAATPGPWAVDDDTYVMCERGPIFDTEYSGPEDSTRVETYEAADAEFIAAANPATVLALLAEIERLRTAEGDAMTYKAGMENVARQRDQLKAEQVSQNGQVDTLTDWYVNALKDAEAIGKDRDQLKAESEALRKALTDIRENSSDLGACECAADALVDSRRQ